MSPAKGSSTGGLSSAGSILRGRPSPSRNKTPKRINLPVTAPSGEVENKKVNRLSRGPEPKKAVSTEIKDEPVPQTADSPAKNGVIAAVDVPESTVCEAVGEQPTVAVEEIYEQEADAEDEEAVMIDNPLAVSKPPALVEDDEEAKDHGSWKYVQEDSPLSDSPEVIQSFRPFQSQQPLTSCLKVKSSRRSSAKFVLDDDDNTHFHRGRQSIINEDDFHTPEASPVSVEDEPFPITSSDDLPKENLKKDLSIEEPADEDEESPIVESALASEEMDNTPVRDDDDSTVNSEGKQACISLMHLIDELHFL
jgi:hypothetical protein